MSASSSQASPAGRVATALVFLVVVVNLPLVHGLLTTDRSVAGGLVGITVFADLALLGVVALMVWGLRSSRHRDVHLVALGDVVRSRSSGSVERRDDGTVTISGEVVELGADRIVIDAGVERVVVDLDGHACPVGYQQRAQVTGRLSESSS